MKKLYAISIAICILGLILLGVALFTVRDLPDLSGLCTFWGRLVFFVGLGAMVVGGVVQRVMRRAPATGASDSESGMSGDDGRVPGLAPGVSDAEKR